MCECVCDCVFVCSGVVPALIWFIEWHGRSMKFARQQKSTVIWKSTWYWDGRTMWIQIEKSRVCVCVYGLQNNEEHLECNTSCALNISNSEIVCYVILLCVCVNEWESVLYVCPLEQNMINFSVIFCFLLVCPVSCHHHCPFYPFHNLILSSSVFHYILLYILYSIHFSIHFSYQFQFLLCFILRFESVCVSVSVWFT